MPKVRYNVIVKTMDVKKAGTDEDVWCQLVGTKGKTAPVHFDKGGYNDFERGDCDTYQILNEDIGDVTEVHMGLIEEREYAGGVDLSVEASYKGGSGSATFRDVQKWGSGHNSPMWKLEYVEVYTRTERRKFDIPPFAPVYYYAHPDMKRFSIERWINVGQFVAIKPD